MKTVFAVEQLTHNPEKAVVFWRLPSGYQGRGEVIDGALAAQWIESLRRERRDMEHWLVPAGSAENPEQVERIRLAAKEAR